jgi:hypothetical protein
MVGNNGISNYDLLGLLRKGQVLKVKCGGFFGIGAKTAGSITIREYQTQPTGAPNGIYNPEYARVGGAVLELVFNKTDDCCCPGGKYRWIQTVTEDTAPPANQYPNAVAPYIDNAKGSPPAPYYNPNGTYPAGTVAFGFRDAPKVLPSELMAQAGRGGKKAKFVVKFKLDLVCASSNNKVLKSIKWGFTYSFHHTKGFKVKLQ